MILTSNELEQINGGGWGLFAILAGIGAFLAGLVDGLLSSVSC